MFTSNSAGRHGGEDRHPSLIALDEVQVTSTVRKSSFLNERKLVVICDAKQTKRGRMELVSFWALSHFTDPVEI